VEQPIEVAGSYRHPLRGPPQVEPGVDVLQVDLTVERAVDEVEADRAHQRLGVWVVD
jgi:hypothetical protein